MRSTRRRAAFILASAAACAVGLFAYAGSASAIPALCVPPAPNTTQGNQSCVNGQILPATGLGPSVPKNVSLFTHVATRYLNPGNRSKGGFAKQVTVYYDNDGHINPLPLGTAPKTHRCPLSAVANKTVPQAYAACGPNGKDAYLSPPGTISGKASTAPPSNFGACTMVFQGKDASHVTLFTRVFTTANSAPACSSITHPYTTNSGSANFNNQGQVAVTLEGTIANAGIAGYGKKLVTPLPSGITLPLDDFYATVKRGNYVTSTCHSPLRIRALFEYSVSTAPYQNDTANFAQACT
jgi:hypothetical protein